MPRSLQQTSRMDSVRKSELVSRAHFEKRESTWRFPNNQGEADIQLYKYIPSFARESTKMVQEKELEHKSVLSNWKHNSLQLLISHRRKSMFAMVFFQSDADTHWRCQCQKRQ